MPITTNYDNDKVTKDESLLEKARRRWKAAFEADAEQREQEEEDLKFQIPENQWSEEAKKERKGRPTLSISKLDQPYQLILNQASSARFGVNIHPLTEDASDDTAEVLQGLYRSIERDSQANKARLWALRRAVLCGRGYWMVNTEYDDDGGSPFDQKITIDPIYYGGSVLFDPAATRPDRSDAEYACIDVWMTADAYTRQWPKAELPSFNSMQFSELDRDAPEWTKNQDKERSYRVVNYYYKDHKKETIALQMDGTIAPIEEIPQGTELMPGPDGKPVMRERDKVTVKLCKLSAAEILEEKELNGKHIPIIPVFGRELTPFDGKRHYVGIINHSKDGQRFYNYAASSYVERMAKEPKVPVIGYAGQFEGFEKDWKQINTRDFPYLEVNPVLDKTTNQILPLPQRLQIDMSGTSLAGQALQTADGMIQATTTVFSAGLGRQDPREKSGRAIQALQQQGDASTSDFMQAYADALAYEAKVVLDLCPSIYDKPGRVVQILRGDDDKSEGVMLNRPFVPHPQTGAPVAIPPPSAVGGPMPQIPGAPPMQSQLPKNAKHFDLNKGRYGVSVTIGKSYQTRLEDGADEIGQLLQSDPSLMAVIGDLYFRFRDFPGAKEIADRLAKVREKTNPGIGEGEDGQAPPEQAAAQVQALQQQLQQAQQQIQQMGQALQTEQAKQQATLMAKQIEGQAKLEAEKIINATKLQIVEMTNAAKIEVARITAAKEASNEAREDQEEALALGIQQQHEADQAALSRAHEAGMAAMDQAHQRQQQQAGAAHDAGMAMMNDPNEQQEPPEPAGTPEGQEGEGQ